MIRAIWNAIAGYKTYGLLALGGVCVLLNGVFGVAIPGVHVDPDAWLQQVLALAAVAAMRHGIRTGA